MVLILIFLAKKKKKKKKKKKERKNKKRIRGHNFCSLVSHAFHVKLVLVCSQDEDEASLAGQLDARRVWQAASGLHVGDLRHGHGHLVGRQPQRRPVVRDLQAGRRRAPRRQHHDGLFFFFF